MIFLGYKLGRHHLNSPDAGFRIELPPSLFSSLPLCLSLSELWEGRPVIVSVSLWLCSASYAVSSPQMRWAGPSISRYTTIIICTCGGQNKSDHFVFHIPTQFLGCCFSIWSTGLINCVYQVPPWKTWGVIICSKITASAVLFSVAFWTR